MTDSEKLDYLVRKFDGLEQKVDAMGQRVEGLGQKVDAMGQKVDVLGQRVDDLEQKVREIGIYQENVLEPGIKVIAEGHANLTRKLNEALKISEAEEMIHLRMNVLECDMVRVKEKLAIV